MKGKLIGLTAILAVAGCAAWRTHGGGAQYHTSAMEFVVPEAPVERQRAALFDSDLGPDTVDVSGYPAEQRRNYELYANACSRCHTLARSINAPWVNRRWWDFYVSKMRVRAMLRREKLPDRELNAVLDFLEYDSHERKVARAPEFERLRQILKRRFQASLDRRIEELQNSPQPILNR
ncbi:MAG: cytochrome c [Elusimicrobia bacterium]|nr:cytochrome c [Elusimicrobiota bacterium]